ncbi:unnamed protein product [Timema podura]|uniref:Glutamine amidotransferase type-2 domain-containing protein n=1 Tax=Timema podura TaxID=61482 RepID=A0ABN7P697_TIMPD|nr:unnamed protein product [Timema podura]
MFVTFFHLRRLGLCASFNFGVAKFTALRSGTAKFTTTPLVLGRGVGLSTHSDSELITQALCLNPPDGEVDGPDWPARIKHLMHLAPLSYSLVIMQKDRIYGVRDPYGNRPLCIGKIVPIKIAGAGDSLQESPEGWVISSESCGFLSIGARYLREVRPGEIVEMTREGIKTISIVERPNAKPQAFCIFEYVYFARSDSIFEGRDIHSYKYLSSALLVLKHARKLATKLSHKPMTETEH